MQYANVYMTLWRL